MSEKREFFMEWREDFDDQWGWFTESELKKEIKRIKKLIDDDEDGEASISRIIKGKNVTVDYCADAEQE